MSIFRDPNKECVICEAQDGREFYSHERTDNFSTILRCVNCGTKTEIRDGYAVIVVPRLVMSIADNQKYDDVLQDTHKENLDDPLECCSLCSQPKGECVCDMGQ